MPLIVLVVLFGLAAVRPAVAQEADLPPLVAETTTRQSLAIEGQSLAYTVKVGTIGLPEEGGPTAARLVYTSYTLDGVDARDRPISFVVNGGPGAASAYLHLGALGPFRLVFGPDGRPPAPPSRVEPNPRTWLVFSDLVFIDPVGTGFSRVGREADAEGDERDYWSVGNDLRAMGGFIRQFLTRNERWGSPKVLVGESYGGFRMAALTQRLPNEFGVALNGVVLISPALEFQLQGGAEWDLLPWVLRVPSMAASANAHGRSSLPGPVHGRTDLAEVESFILGPLLTTLAQPAAPGSEVRRAAFERLAGLIGLPVRIVERERGRIGIGRFAEELLDEQRRRVSVYDGRIDTPIGPGGERGDDGYLTQFTAALATGFAAYSRDELGVGASLPYLVLNREVFRRWDWDGDGRPGGSRVGAADELAQALVANPTLHALITHGMHDLVTPYFTSVYLMDQLLAGSDARARLAIRVYPGGHMFYSRDASLEMLHRDAEALFEEINAQIAGG